MTVGVYKGLVWRASHLVEDVGDKSVALHAGRVGAWVAVGPGHAACLLDSLVGSPQVVAVMLVCVELVHNLLPRNAEEVADVPAAIGVVQVPNVLVARSGRLSQGNAVERRAATQELLNGEDGCQGDGQNPLPQRAPPSMAWSHVGTSP